MTISKINYTHLQKEYHCSVLNIKLHDFFIIVVAMAAMVDMVEDIYMITVDRTGNNVRRINLQRDGTHVLCSLILPLGYYTGVWISTITPQSSSTL